MPWSVPKIWKDSECWIIGGGASVRDQFGIPESLVPETKEQFREFGDYLSSIHDKRVIGVNMACFLGDWVDVAFWGDSDTYTDQREWFSDFGGLKVSCHPSFDGKKFPDVMYLKRFKSRTQGITLNPSEVGWGFNSGFAALNLAVHLGAKKIVLLGFDMYKHPKHGRVHWHAGYIDKTKIPTRRQRMNGITAPRASTRAPFSKHMEMFPIAAKEIDKLGIQVLNACPDSALKCFPRVSVQEALKGGRPTVKIEQPQTRDKKSNSPNEILEIRCVLKSGGVYGPDYVYRLKKAVESNCILPHKFTCLSDIPLDFCDTIPLLHGWPGWWSKIELFRPDLPHNPVLYLDLDTVVLNNIDQLLEIAGKYSFAALRGFNHRFKKPGHMNFASGIMAGRFHEYSKVYQIFKRAPNKNIAQVRENWQHGDQGFIAEVIGVDNAPRLQDFLPENYIVGKRIIRDRDGIPEESAVIAWSGNPRLASLVGRNEKIYRTINHLWRRFDG